MQAVGWLLSRQTLSLTWVLCFSAVPGVQWQQKEETWLRAQVSAAVKPRAAPVGCQRGGLGGEKPASGIFG